MTQILEQILQQGNLMEVCFEWNRKTRGPVSQQVWHEKKIPSSSTVVDAKNGPINFAINHLYMIEVY